MQIKRREFLKRSALGLGAMLAGSQLSAIEIATPDKQVAPAAKFFDPFEQVTLGKSGLKFSRVCMGTGTNGWSHQSNQTRLGKDTFQRLLREAYERGVRTFDLADQYGTNPYLAGPMFRATVTRSSQNSAGRKRTLISRRITSICCCCTA